MRKANMQKRNISFTFNPLSNPGFANSCFELHFQVKSRVVHTKYGRVQGFGARVGRDAQQQKYVEIFLGIPYASPPTGSNR